MLTFQQDILHLKGQVTIPKQLLIYPYRWDFSVTEASVATKSTEAENPRFEYQTGRRLIYANLSRLQKQNHEH